MRMNRKRWIIASVLTVVLAVGVFTAGIVAAQVADDSKGNRFTARVAQILNLDEDTVHDAMAQASRELREESAQEKLNELVAAGEITQAQADEYMAWIQSAPESIYEMKGRGFGRDYHGRKGRHGRGFFH